MLINSPVPFDRIAVETSVRLIERTSTADLTLPTPCEGWTLRDLVAHMTAQHHGFAAAAKGEVTLDVWRTRSLGENHVATYRAAADTVTRAFADDVLDREFTLPEFGTDTPFPGRQAVRFHFLDYVVHSWDVAKTLGVEVHFAEDVMAAALDIARAVPDGASRLAPGAAFRPPVPRTDTSTMDTIVALLGRGPFTVQADSITHRYGN